MIGKRQSSSARRLGVLLASAVILSACGSDMDDLRAYIDEVKARPGGRIEPLPEIRPTPTFVYAADRDGARSPFVPDTPQARVSADPDAVRGPDPNRPREFLEQFPLDTLRMVGTVASEGRVLRTRPDLGWLDPSRQSGQPPGAELRPDHNHHGFRNSAG